jgi:ABC-type uncharacterized transport system involved in gliding motility auxiliary subunit
MKTLGKISGGLGLLVLLSSPFTLLLTSGSMLAAGIKAAVGAALLVFWFVTRPARGNDVEIKGTMGESARAGFFYGSSALMICGLLVAVVAVNFIAARRGKTWDLTRQHIHSLAPQTIQALNGLKEPIRVIGFLGSTHAEAREEFEPVLKRYADASEKFTYEFKDPFKSPELVQRYGLHEGQLPIILTQGTGEAQTHSGLNSDSLTEESLTRALVKLNTIGTQKIYFVVGHGEWTLGARESTGADDLGNFTSAFRFNSGLAPEGYAPEQLNLADSRNIPRDASLLIIAAAEAKFADREIALLEEYLGQGGRLIYLAEQGREPGLDALLAKYGVQIDNGVLTEDPRNPYVVISSSYADHEITKPFVLRQLNFEVPTARGLSLIKQGVLPGVLVTPLATTSTYAWEETTPGEDHPSLDSGEKSGAIPLVVAVTRNTRDATEKRFDEARLVVFGDAQFLTDGLLGHDPNRDLAMNAVAWASSQIQNITIRPPDRDLSTIDLDETMLAKIRFVSMDLLPVLLLGVGLSIWVTRRNK